MGPAGKLFQAHLSLLVLLFSSLAISEIAAHAYTPTLSTNGISVRWQSQVKLNLAGNPVNASGLSQNDVYASVVHALQRWKQASGGTVQFDYWQGDNPSVYEPDSEFNGLSSIYFSSNTANSRLSASILGLTQVWYDTTSGNILETDIELNDKDFHFTTNSRDTSGYGSASSSPLSGRVAVGNHPNVFVENVITHEVGHALGLSHSGAMQSTMLFMESPEQAHLGCDDQIAIRALYPADDAGARGAISGQVVAESGAPLFGAHVVAISRRRGVALATALADHGGNFTINALEPGSYFLMLEPFYAGSTPLPGYYASVNTAICRGGRQFGRILLSEASGPKLTPIQVSAGGMTRAPQLVARCGNSTGAMVASEGASSSSSSAPPLIYDGTQVSNVTGFGASDRFSAGGMTYYEMKGLSGSVEIHTMSYSLYSPMRVGTTLVDSSGTTVSAQYFTDSYEGDSGYVNYDSYLIASNLPPGNYTLKVSSLPMDASLYPAGPVAIDSSPFLVITGSIGEGDPALASTLAVNGRCKALERFGAYSSPPGDPPRREMSNTSGAGFCGMIDTGRGGRGGGGGGSRGGSDGPGPGPGVIAGWFLPWALMAAMARMAKVLWRPKRLAPV